MVRRLVTACLLVLAGCSGLSASGPDTSTVTPAPVPETGAQVSSERVLVPGLTSTGVTDPKQLADAHRDALGGRSFTLLRNWTVEGPNGTLARWERRLRVGRGWERYRSHRTMETAPDYRVSAYRPHLDTWYDGESVYVRGVRDGEVLFERQRGNALGDVTRADRLRRLYAAFETRVRRTDDGYHVTGTYLTDPTMLDTPPLLVDPRDARFVALLEADGRVRRYLLTYGAAFEDISPTRGRRYRVRVVETAQFRGVNETTVERPDWYEEAKNATAESPVSELRLPSRMSGASAMIRTAGRSVRGRQVRGSLPSSRRERHR